MNNDKTLSLYQQYRPNTFSQIIGQKDIVQYFKNAVVNDSVSSAYLFVGERGCGKTSTAKILARAVNCESLTSDGEPCNKCDSCISISRNESLNVIEYDAGSNSGVDAMKEIINQSRLVSPGKRKVIIIDEAHLLSNSATSALLAPLEFPPAGVTFILCTTEKRNILKTIQSRCQVNNFKLIEPSVMGLYIKKVTQHAGLEVTDDDITNAILLGQGSVRETLSTIEAISKGLVMVRPDAQIIVETLVAGDNFQVLSALATSIQHGEAPRELTESMFSILRDCFLIVMGAEQLVATPDWGNRDVTAKALGARNITYAIDHLGQAIQGIQSGGDPRVNLELALMRYCAITKK